MNKKSAGKKRKTNRSDTMLKNQKNLEKKDAILALTISKLSFLMSFTSFAVGLFCVGYIMRILIISDWHGKNFLINILFSLVAFFLIYYIFTVSKVFFCAYREIKKDKDKELAATLLSGLVGLFAIVIALLLFIVEVKKWLGGNV